MTSTPFELGQARQVGIGNDAGWVLAFRRELPLGLTPVAELELSSDDYYASIDATLPDGLGPGAYRITIEGLLDEHFAQLGIGKGTAPLVCHLYLFWRDANSSAFGYLRNLGGVNKGPSSLDLLQAQVAVLRVTKVSRRAGERSYDTELTLIEEAYARLGANRVAARFDAPSFAAAIQTITDRTKVPLTPHGVGGDGLMTHPRGEAEGTEKVTFGEGLLFTAAVERLGNALEQSLNRYGRGMVLIRAHRPASRPPPGGLPAEAAHPGLRPAGVGPRRRGGQRSVRSHRGRREQAGQARRLGPYPQGPARPQAGRRGPVRAAAQGRSGQAAARARRRPGRWLRRAPPAVHRRAHRPGQAPVRQLGAAHPVPLGRVRHRRPRGRDRRP